MRIFLRPVTEKDSSNIVKWRNSEKVKKHCFSKAIVTEDSNLRFFRENVLSGKYKQYIVERVEEELGLAAYPIATVYLKDMDDDNRRCELCIFTSDDVEWGEEGQSIAIQMLLEKAFSEFGLHKVYSYVFAKYPEELALLKKAGFNEEAILKEEALGEGGKYEDVIRVCIIKGN